MNEQVISFEQIVERGCGMDVHNETVVAIVSGNGIKAETRTFFTHTNDLYNCKDWLKELRVTHIAMEAQVSTGSLYLTILMKILRFCWSMPGILKTCRGIRLTKRTASGLQSYC
ncbi:MAG TPA: hypothetical protein VFD00_10360 [Thermoclostridium sp.]|nr:hypothetical protein [Thermoclostridium sp.]